MQKHASAEKHIAFAKHGKTCNWCQARKNLLPVASARKWVLLIDLKELTMNSDWLEQRPEQVIRNIIWFLSIHEEQ